MDTFTELQRAFDKRLDALGLSETIVYENTHLKPTLGTTYLTTSLITDTSSTSKVDGSKLVTGEYSLDIFTELEKGVAAYNSLVDSLDTHFSAQDTLTEGGTEVWLHSVSRTQPVRDEQMLLGNVSIQFSVYT